MYIPSAYYRRKALAALKGHWQPALLVALIVNLPTLLMQGFSAFTGNDVFNRLQAVIVAASRDGVMDRSVLLNEIDAILASTSFWTVRGLEILALLVTPCLALGMYKWLMELLRGQEEPVSAVFSRMRLFFKAIGLQLLVILKVLLWMLPGIAVMAFAAYPAVTAGTQELQLAALMRFQNMSLPIMLLMIIPGVMAALRYALSEYILAEKPETKILACVRRSRELMNGRKKDLFLLALSFLLWYLLELVISSMLPGVLGLIFQMLTGLMLNIWMSASICVFYLRLEGAAAAHESPDAEPAPEELN